MVSNFINNNLFFFILATIVAILLYVLANKIPRPIWGIKYHRRIRIWGDKYDITKLSYNNKTYYGISVTDLFFINNGRHSIRRENVAEPVNFIFGNGDIIDIINTKLDNNTVSIKSIDKNTVRVDFDYLNPHEGVKFTAIHTAYPEEIKVNAEFIDAKLAKRRKIDIVKNDFMILKAIIWYTTVISAYIFLILYMKTQNILYLALLVIVAVIYIISILMTVITISARYRKIQRQFKRFIK